jgi:FkbM family methyltransferase|tara:strand:- start:3708 stop:4469 length:762 start_codon:yes stop_codon:yes gene_type:complete
MYIKKIFHLFYVYYIKVIRNDNFIVLSKKRRYLRNLSNKLNYVDSKFEKIANYYIPIDYFNGSEVVASFGVGSDIEFENQLVDRYKHEIFLFDPTPRSVEYIENFKNLKKNLKFFPLGISTKKGVHKFYQMKPWSDYTLVKPKRVFDEISVEFIDVKELIKIVNKPIKLLKLDIEGAALSIVHEIIKYNLLPELEIIIAEFELPMYQTNEIFEKFQYELDEFLLLIDNQKWDLFLIPKEKNKYLSLEVVLISN